MADRMADQTVGLMVASKAGCLVPLKVGWLAG